VKLRSHKHAILLAAMVVVVIVESFNHRLVLGPVASDLAISGTQLLAFLTIFDEKINRRVALVALSVAFVSAWAHYVMPENSPQDGIRLANHSALLLLFGFATIVMLRHIFEQRVVRIDDVIGAVCGYILAGAAWAHLFMVIEIFVPGCFSVGQGFGIGLDTWHGRLAVLNYVSLGSLTGVGSGQVVAVRPPATVLTALEAVFGQFYIAIVVAQLVGARLSQGLKQTAPPTSE